MDSNASGAICALPECQRPCFEERGGFVYDYCGRSHAEEMRRRRQGGGADRQLGAYGEKGCGKIGDHPYPMTGVDPWGPFEHSPGAGSENRAGGNGGGRVDASLVRTTDDFVLFWQEPACFVQWTACTFEVQGVRYCTAEQFMMARKAVEFGDSEAHQQIMATSDPREQKALGRRVKGFVPAVWDKAGYGVVVEGNLAKFRQNPHFRDELLATGDRILAEASPYDKEWGIGLHVDDPNALVQARWKGKNKLGMALMEVRFILQKERKEKEGKAEDEGYDKEERILRCCLFFKRDNRVCERGRA